MEKCDNNLIEKLDLPASLLSRFKVIVKGNYIILLPHWDAAWCPEDFRLLNDYLKGGDVPLR